MDWPALERHAGFNRLTPEDRLAVQVAATVWPFRVNAYVADELIDWDCAPDDPMFRLTFPQRGMLADRDFVRMRDLVLREAPKSEIDQAANAIRLRHNPHPAGQADLNVPKMDGERVRGVQHKYRETVLFFPSQGQQCHAYCSYCFRWPQFVGLDDLKFANSDVNELLAYLRRHPEVTDVIFTGGDPMIMKTRVLRRYIEPLLAPAFGHVTSIRIGTKAPAYWPQRFVSDSDADDLLRLFEKVRSAGRNLALMAHYSHPRELRPRLAREAVRRIRDAGAVVRCQAPIVRHVNDDADAWADLWRAQVRVGAVPYYMFVERDTGPRNYFEVPLARALKVYNDAIRQTSGLARTARGPSMSATPGKVLIDGVVEMNGDELFVLKMIQARNPAICGNVYFAEFDSRACWLDDLEPAFDHWMADRPIDDSDELLAVK
jgi:KamA family protein